MVRDEFVKYLFFHFVHLGFNPIVHVTHLAAYGLSLVLNVSPDLYRYDGSWLYGLSLFLLSSLAFALALKDAKSFFHVFLLGHKYALVYFSIVYYEAVKAAAVFPLATTSFVALDFLFHTLTYTFIRLRQTLGRLAEAQPT